MVKKPDCLWSGYIVRRGVQRLISVDRYETYRLTMTIHGRDCHEADVTTDIDPDTLIRTGQDDLAARALVECVLALDDRLREIVSVARKRKKS